MDSENTGVQPFAAYIEHMQKRESIINDLVGRATRLCRRLGEVKLDYSLTDDLLTKGIHALVREEKIFLTDHKYDIRISATQGTIVATATVGKRGFQYKVDAVLDEVNLRVALYVNRVK